MGPCAEETKVAWRNAAAAVRLSAGANTKTSMPKAIAASCSAGALTSTEAVPLSNSATLRASGSEPRLAAADPVPPRHLDGRLRGGVHLVARQGRSGPVGIDDLAAEEWTDEHTLWKKRDLSARRFVYV